MARFDFGGTLADFVVTSRRLGGLDTLALSSATLTFWSAQTGGTRYTDLQLNGAAVSSIAVGTDGQVPTFQGPDTVTVMWVDGGSGRVRIVAQGIPGPAGPGAANSDVAGYVGTGATKTALDAAYARAMGWVVATDPTYGAVGDWTGGTSGTDNTTALQAALTAANARGTVCFIPAAAVGYGYRFTSLTLGAHTQLRGAGYTALMQENYGGPQWNNTANRSQCRGTVLYSTVASGNAIKGDDPVAARWQLSDFLLIGPGSGTATGISLAETGSFNIRPNVSNVMVANFPRGWKIGTTNEAQLDSMVAYACQTGFDFGPFFNANVVTNIEVQRSTVEGIRLSGVCNEFVGGIIQGVSGTTGLHVLTGSPDNEFRRFYSENNLGATDAVLFESEVSYGGHFASNGGNVRVTVSGCLFEHVYAPSSTLTLGTSLIKTVLLRSSFSSIVANGSQVVDLGSFSAGIKSHILEVGDPGATGSWAFQTQVSGRSRITDIVNNHDQIIYYPGATNATALSQFGSVIGLASSTTAARPNAGNFFPGAMWYDTTLGKPIWSNGTNWRDASGTVV